MTSSRTTTPPTTFGRQTGGGVFISEAKQTQDRNVGAFGSFTSFSTALDLLVPRSPQPHLVPSSEPSITTNASSQSSQSTNSSSVSITCKLNTKSTINQATPVTIPYSAQLNSSLSSLPPNFFLLFSLFSISGNLSSSLSSVSILLLHQFFLFSSSPPQYGVPPLPPTSPISNLHSSLSSSLWPLSD
ncbi:hypothetical protein M0R45_007540 [Rubus argutus]|uniref:Uncharacterized protein n=1 Tax=Rubus argutus TaxID=59490 RepID=A0AAW1XYJ4_RUBAR